MIITLPGNFKGILYRDQEFRRKALRDRRELHLPRYKTAIGQSTFECAAAKECNDLHKDLRAFKTLRILTFNFLIELDKAQHKCSV